MKKFRKLIPAFVLLLISTAIMSTATFAWFSMNTTVSATNMSVTAKSDQIFLLIKEGTNTAEQVQTAKLTSDEATNSSAVLLPAAHHEDSSSVINDYDNYANWYWQTSADPDSSVPSSAEFEVGSSALGQYVLINTFTITVAEGSNPVRDLKVASCKITTEVGGAEAVKVVVATSSASEEFGTLSSSGTAGSVILHAGNLTSAQVEIVKIYIYWDGNDAEVYTNNILNLKNTSVEVTFTGEVSE